jgi:hypothetical protein
VTETASVKKRDADLAENDKRIGGNQRILGMADQIGAAVTAVAAAEAELAGLRAELSERQNERWKADTAVRAVERSIAALAPVEQRLDRSTRDAGLLASVPCGGAGEFAACQFLVDAKHAEAQIEDLKAKLEPKAALADQLSTGLKAVDLLDQKLIAVTGRISAMEAAVAKHAEYAKYAAPLAEATAKIAGYEDGERLKPIADADDPADRRRRGRAAPSGPSSTRRRARSTPRSRDSTRDHASAEAEQAATRRRQHAGDRAAG